MTPLDHAVGCLNGWDLVRIATSSDESAAAILKSIHLTHGWVADGVWCVGEPRGYLIRYGFEPAARSEWVTWAALGAAVEGALSDEVKSELLAINRETSDLYMAEREPGFESADRDLTERQRAVAERVKGAVRGGVLQLALFGASPGNGDGTP